MMKGTGMVEVPEEEGSELLPSVTHEDEDLEGAQVPVEITAPKSRLCLYFLVGLCCVAGLVAAAFAVAPQASDPAFTGERFDSAHLFEVTFGGEPKLQTIPKSEHARYAQSRPRRSAHGQGPRYSIANDDPAKVRRRVERFAQIQAIRFGYCGGFEQHLAWVQDGSQGRAPTNWRVLPAYDPNSQDIDARNIFVYAPSLRTIFGRSNLECFTQDAPCAGSGKSAPSRSVCETAHPWRTGYTLTIERTGSFDLLGGYDWATIIIRDIGGLADRYRGKDVSVAGGMFAPTFANGTIIGYPPVHVHHAHLYPYGSSSERAQKLFDPERKNGEPVIHTVMVQVHGDSECAERSGGKACMYREPSDDDAAYGVYNTMSGLGGDVQLNNVLDTPVRGVYIDSVIAHKLGAPERAATSLHVGNGRLGDGFSTFDIPADPSTAVVWFKYTSPFAGTLSGFHAHAHQTMFDSMFLIRGKGVHEALDARRRDGPLPMVLECDADWRGNLEAAKSELLQLALNVPGAELVCEVARPSLQFDCAEFDKHGECAAYDKAMDLNCLESIRVAQGDELAVLGFSRSRGLRGARRASRRFWDNIDGEFFALKQHNIFRMTHVHDEVDLPRNPGALYRICAFPAPYPLGPADTDPHGEITRNCPASISFNGNRTV